MMCKGKELLATEKDRNTAKKKNLAEEKKNIKKDCQKNHIWQKNKQ